MSFLSEFKTFAMRGNVVDLAVGVVIGAAFGKIVSSLVGGIIMPLIGLLLGGINIAELAVTLEPAVIAADGSVTEPAVMLKYGAFLQTGLDFLIIAMAIFLLVKAINTFNKKQEAEPAKTPAPSEEQILLTEIRDLLKASALR